VKLRKRCPVEQISPDIANIAPELSLIVAPRVRMRGSECQAQDVSEWLKEQRLVQWHGEQQKAAADVALAIENLASNLGCRHVSADFSLLRVASARSCAKRRCTYLFVEAVGLSMRLTPGVVD
jgi:hypothetical protein